MAGRSGEIEDLLHCMICFESFRSPKMLRCCHTFCAECLEGYLKTYQQQRRAAQGKLPCPTCREMTSLSAGGVSGLRTDFKVAKIEEMFRTVNLRERNAQNKTCDSCRTQKKQVMSNHYCTSCSKNYCDDCLHRHDNNPVFKGHQVLDKGSDVAKDVFCKVHSTEQVKFFCRACEMLVCTLCIMNTHESHKVIEITSVYKQHRQDIQNLQDAVDTKLAALRNRCNDLDKIRQLNLQSYQKAEIDIKNWIRDVTERIQKEEETLLVELRTKRDEKLRMIRKEQDSTNFHVAKACSLRDFASATSRRNSLRMMAIHEELIQRMKTVSTLEPLHEENDVSSVLAFKPPRQDVQLGTIDFVPMKPTDVILPAGAAARVPSASIEALSSPQPVFPIAAPISYKAQLLIDIHKVGPALGEIKDPLGVAVLPNGDFVVSEWGNKRLQIFDIVGKPVAIIAQGQIGPQGVAVTLKGNIMITDAENKRLEVFSQNGNSIAKWGLGKFFGPCGVAVSANGQCVITDITEHTVNIYQGESKLYKRFGGKGRRQDQLHNPLYVCTGRSSEIIVSDSDNHAVKVFDADGKFLRKFGSEGRNDGQLAFPRGVCCLDSEGKIAVADRNNDRISLFTANGGFIRHLLTREDGIREPYGIAVTPTRNLIVTSSGPSRASVKMFQL